jgi:hypothetical protein
MSVDFVIVCEGPRPSDWPLEGSVATPGLPFSFGLEPVDKWRQATLEWLDECAEDDEPTDFQGKLRAFAARRWSFVARMSCRAKGASITDDCAQELLACFGGFYYDDHAAEIRWIKACRVVANGAEVLEAWRGIVADEQALTERAAQAARSEFAKAAKRDPAAHAEANDWSDVPGDD